MKDANSTEMNRDTPYPVIDLMETQKKVKDLGGTMRLGAYNCKLDPKSKSYEAYGVEGIRERHRHRYEFNNEYRKIFEENGVRLAGINPEEDLVEIIEIKDHPWFVGVQFHPEYRSTVKQPHPLFVNFVKAALEHKKEAKH